jgi:hypothetical protein|tara:strand:+ start:316 stop:951 length:636 start_codon:yes stop_codon:yes gene_type:complete
MANLNIPNTKDRTLDSFKGRMIGGGARPNLFECELYFPQAAIPLDTTRSQLTDRSRFLVKAANLPASNVAAINIPFRGRNLKVAGDRTFDIWTITVINDVDFGIRTAFERWMNLINKHEDNAGITNPTSYQRDMFVRQLGRSGVTGTTPSSDTQVPVLKQYRFYGTFPTNVSAIDLSYDSTDQIEDFTVDLQVQWFDALDPGGNSQLGTGS